MIPPADHVTAPEASDVREKLSSLRGLNVLSMLMIQQRDEDQIIHLATTAIPALGRARSDGIILDGSWHEPSATRDQQMRRSIEAQLSQPGAVGGPLQLAGRAWASAIPLQPPGGSIGWMIVSADHEPTDHEQFLLRTLAQHLGVSLVTARTRGRERDRSEQLESTHQSLERTMEIRGRLTKAALGNPGQNGIARALHELTGLDVVIEDAHGNLRAWAGQEPPHPYRKLLAEEAETILECALDSGMPLRDRDRLVAVARSNEEILGVIALIDPNQIAGPREAVALEFSATMLATELGRLRNRADTDMSLRRELTDLLLSGADREAVMNRAQALGYDLGRPHRVSVVRAERATDEALLQAVRRAARDTGAGSLLAPHSGEVVLISNIDVPWEKLRVAVRSVLGGSNCRIGVGTVCRQLADFPKSFKEAHVALKMQEDESRDDRVTMFEDLGVFQLLAELPNTGPIDQFIDRWLGLLIEHDAAKDTQLVKTLTVYLECGGKYDPTAAGLFVHRSTLKGRLGRIRSISGHDLADPETRFNLQLATSALKTREAFRQT